MQARRLLVPVLRARPGRRDSRQGAVPFSCLSPASPMTPLGFLLAPGEPVEHYPGRKPLGLNEQRLLSEGAALLPQRLPGSWPWAIVEGQS